MSIPTQEQLDEALARGARSMVGNVWESDTDSTVPVHSDVGFTHPDGAVQLEMLFSGIHAVLAARLTEVMVDRASIFPSMKFLTVISSKSKLNSLTKEI